jgi:ribosome-binding factor A
MKTVSQRQKKVSSELRSQIAAAWQKALQWEKNFNASLISITELSVSPDLRQAFVLISALDPNYDLQSIAQRLNAISGNIARHLAPHISLKRIPRLFFKASDPQKAHLEILLQSIRKESTQDSEACQETDLLPADFKEQDL